MALGEGHCLRAVVPEVQPGFLVQLPGDAPLGHEPADDLLRAVVGAGIDDHPAVDMRGDRFDQLVNDVRLVADDHVQADPRPGSLAALFTRSQACLLARDTPTA